MTPSKAAFIFSMIFGIPACTLWFLRGFDVIEIDIIYPLTLTMSQGLFIIIQKLESE